MKKSLSLCSSLLALATLGCATEAPHKFLEGNDNMWVSDWFRTASVHEAIITQSTLYPYQFATGSAQLNDLGRQALDVLAKHLKENPGRLNVHRGPESQELYEARVAHVAGELRTAGLGPDQVTIVDFPPGGAGMASEQLIVIQSAQPSGSILEDSTSSMTTGDN